MEDVTTENRKSTWNQAIYDQLIQIAEQALRREPPGHALQPTMLANDAYLRLLDQRNLKQRRLSQRDRSCIVAAGANIIRRLLVDYARKRKTMKRGGRLSRLSSSSVSIADKTNYLVVLELNDALETLGMQRPRAARVVELKFFGGLTSEEIGEQIGVSLRTVKNDWRFAKSWLCQELGSDSAKRGS